MERTLDHLEFVADDWFKIAGRGWVAAITNENDTDQLPWPLIPTDLVNRYLKIDGKEYYVTGVETQGYSRKHFGLLVRGEK